MGDKRFDQLLKGKLEAHQDMSKPSDAELNRLKADLPVGPASILTTANVAIASVILILTISTTYFYYQTVNLKEEIELLTEETVKSTQVKPSIILVVDSLAVDSLSHVIVGLSHQLDSSFAILSLKNSDQNRNAPDSIEWMEAAMLSVMDQLLQDSMFINQIVAEELAKFELAENEKKPEQNAIIKEPTLKEYLTSENLVEPVFHQLASDSTGQVVLNNLRSHLPPNADPNDQLTMNASMPLDSLDTRQKEALISEILEYESASVTRAAILAGGDSVVIERLAANLTYTPKVQDTLQLSRNSGVDQEAIREAQSKNKDRAHLIDLVVGRGIVSAGEVGTGTLISVGGGYAYQLNPHLAIGIQVKYHQTSVENHAPGPTLLSGFERYDETAIVKELKADYQWVDVPLEITYYFLPEHKLRPFVQASSGVRMLTKEDYTIETDKGYENQEVDDVNMVGVPIIAYGLGGTFQVNRTINAIFSINQMPSTTETGSQEVDFKNLRFEVRVGYRIK